MDNINQNQNQMPEMPVGGGSEISNEISDSRRKIYIAVAVVAVVVLAVLWWWSSRPDVQESTLTPASSAGSTSEIPAELQDIDQELEDLDLSDLDQEFEQIDQELETL